MESEDQNASAVVPGLKDLSLQEVAAVDVDGTGLKIGICRARWNKEVIDALFDGAKEAILKTGVRESDIHVIEVPGSFELPLAAKKLLKACDAVVCLGCLIKGETMHFEYICGPVSEACMKLGQEMEKPCIFGVLCCLTEEQARVRAGLTPDGHNHGPDWGSAAVEMAVKMKAPIPGMKGNSRNKPNNSRQRRKVDNQRRAQGKNDDDSVQANNGDEDGQNDNNDIGNDQKNNNQKKRGGKKGGGGGRGRRNEKKVKEEKGESAPAPAPESQAE